MTEQEKKDAIFKEFEDKLSAATKGLASSDELTQKFNEMKESLNGDVEKIKALEADVVKALKEISAQGEELTKLRQGQQPKAKRLVSVKDLANKFVESESFKELAEYGTMRKPFELKDVSFGGNYTDFSDSPATVTMNTNEVNRYPYQSRPIRVRDVIPSVTTDQPSIICEEIVDFVNNIKNNSETGSLNELTFVVNPVPYQKKRIGGYIDVSKDILKSRAMVMSEIERQLPMMYYYQEDNQLLNGDGTGNNVLGLFKNTKTRALDDLESSYSAGAISSVEDFGNGKVKVTFAAGHNLFDNDTLTIAASTNYNASYLVSVHTTTIVVIEATYASEATSAWTGTRTSKFNEKVDNANTADVASAAMRILRQGYYKPSAIFIDPVNTFDMERAKGTDGHYLGNVKRESGVLFVDGVPVVETDVVPAGKIYIADTANAARIYDYEGLTIRYSSDATLDIQNKVRLIVEAHVIMANFNPLMTMAVDIAGVKTDLETP